MKYLLAFSIFLVSFSSNGQASKQIFEAPDFKTEIKQHKIIAILPLKVTISYKKLPKGFDAEGNRLEEIKQGLGMQEAMYTFILRKSKDYTVTCQDVETTNILLKKAGIYDKLDENLKDSICKVLKVDAVINATYAYEKTASEAGAIAKSLIFGGFGGSVASGLLTMQIYNGKDGKLLWRFSKEMNEGAFSTANEMVERMMRKVTRNFPYEK